MRAARHRGWPQLMHGRRQRQRDLPKLQLPSPQQPGPQQRRDQRPQDLAVVLSACCKHHHQIRVALRRRHGWHDLPRGARVPFRRRAQQQSSQKSQSWVRRTRNRPCSLGRWPSTPQSFPTGCSSLPTPRAKRRRIAPWITSCPACGAPAPGPTTAARGPGVTLEITGNGRLALGWATSRRVATCITVRA